MTEQPSVEALVERVRQYLAIARQAGYDPADGYAALDSLTAALERERRSEWREGIVNVLDHEGNYLGCLGSETWEWTLAGGIEELRAALERMAQAATVDHDHATMQALRAERAERERDAAWKATDRAEQWQRKAEAALWEITRKLNEAVARAQKAEAERDKLSRALHLEGRVADANARDARKAEAERDELTAALERAERKLENERALLREADEQYEAAEARAQKAEAVVEAARKLSLRYGGEAYNAAEEFEDALTAYDEPPTAWTPQEC